MNATEKNDINVKRLATLANFIGGGQTFKNRMYQGFVYTGAVRWMMTEGDMHWLCNDIMIKARFTAKIMNAYHITVKVEKNRVAYYDADENGDNVLVACQNYSGGMDAPEGLTLYIVNHYDGDRPCKLLMYSKEY